jgi:hypothetical protein
LIEKQKAVSRHLALFVVAALGGLGIWAETHPYEQCHALKHGSNRSPRQGYASLLSQRVVYVNFKTCGKPAWSSMSRREARGQKRNPVGFFYATVGAKIHRAQDGRRTHSNGLDSQR